MTCKIKAMRFKSLSYQVWFFIILSILHEHSQVSPDLNSESTLLSNNPASFDIVPVYEKSSQLSEQVCADIHPEVLNTKHFRSRYAKFIVIGVKYNRHVG